MVGGVAPNNIDELNTLEAYDVASNTWTTLAPAPTVLEGSAAAAGPDGKIYVFGGFNFNSNNFISEILDSVEAYDPATNTWTTVASLPTQCATAAAVLAPNGLIYVFGGVNNQDNGGLKNVSLDTVQAYDPATNTWTTKSPMPTARQGLAAALGPDGLIYVFGGATNNGGQVLDTVEAYNPATDTWTTKTSMPIARDNFAAAPGPDGRIYIIGGFSPAALPGQPEPTEIDAYDPATDTWTTVASMPTPRTYPAAALGVDGRIHVFGGSGDGIQSATIAYQPAGMSATASTTVQLATPAVQVTAAPGPFFATEGQASPVQTLATFTDPAGAGSLAEYAAQVNWGDGFGFVSDPNVTISGPVNGVFTVSGSHLYANVVGINSQLQVQILHEGTTSNTVGVALDVIDPPVVVTAAAGPFTATEGQTSTVQALATFTDPGGAEPLADYSALVNWGDGSGFVSDPNVAISGPVNGVFTVSGSHLYANVVGINSQLQVQILHEGTTSNTVGVTLDLIDPPVVVTAAAGPFTATEGQTSTVQALATFTDPGGAEPLADYSALVNWGDGSGFVSDPNVTISEPSGGVFTVSGSHLYTNVVGVSNQIQVQILHEGTTSNTVGVTLNLIDPPVVVTAAGPFTATAGQASAVQTMATFTDPGGAEPLADYSALVNWGDGSGFISDPNATISEPSGGVFTVSGSHFYADVVGVSNQIQVQILHEGTTSNIVSVALDLIDPPVVVTAAGPFTATEGQTSTVQPLATFTDPGGAAPLAQYSALVNWGDGSGFVSDPNVAISGPSVNGVFTVSGSHLYTEVVGVSNQIQVQILHEGTTSNIVSVALDLIDPPVVVTAAGPFTATEGQTSVVQTLATFTDPGGAEALAQYSVQVNWGDGGGFISDPNATISGPSVNGVFTVSGSHLYTEVVGVSNQIQVQILHEGTTSNTVGVPLDLIDPPVVVTAAGPFTATEGQTSVVQTLATFTDPGGAEALAQYSVQVNWGDGGGFISDPNATISGPSVNGVFTVSGSHLYTEVVGVSNQIQVQILHEGTTSNTVGVPLDLIDPPVVVTAAGPFTATEGQTSIVQPLATFTDPGGAAPLAQYSALVNWGDGSGFVSDPTVTISGPIGGVFTVSGSHLYTNVVGVSSQIQVQILHEGTTSNTVSVALDLIDPPVVVTAATGPFTAIVGQTSAVQTLATFTDPGGAEPLAQYSPLVNWGDGSGFISDPNVTISGPVNGVFTVSGSHRYTQGNVAGHVQVQVLHEGTTSNTVQVALQLITPAGDVDPAVMADNSTILAGSQAGFTVIVSSEGASTGVTLSDPLPAGAGDDLNWHIDPTAGNPSAFTVSGAVGSQVLTLSGLLVSMANGQSLTVHITALTTAADVGRLSDTATTSPNPDNDGHPFTATIAVDAAAVFTSVNSTTFSVGSAGSFTVTASGFPIPTLSESAGDTRPSGVTFNARTGVLSGTPAAGTGGTYTLHFTAHNGAGSDATQTFTLAVNQAPAFISGNTAALNVGSNGSFTVQASGFPAPTLSENPSDVLPTGVLFNAATGLLSGTPAAGTAGSYTLHFTAHNGAGSDATQTLTLTVNPAQVNLPYQIIEVGNQVVAVTPSGQGSTVTVLDPNGNLLATIGTASPAKAIALGNNLFGILLSSGAGFEPGTVSSQRSAGHGAESTATAQSAAKSYATRVQLRSIVPAGAELRSAAPAPPAAACRRGH